jgi:dissimilatory sulfite reductase related protein
MNSAAGRQLNAGDVHQKSRILGGKEVLVDKEGFLWHPEDWTDDVAMALARESGIEQLGDAQWRVIRFLRDYFFYHGRAPLNRDLKAGLGMSLLELEGLFPEGIRRGARRLAGLPNPKTCSG